MSLSINRDRLCSLLEKATPCEPPQLVGFEGDVSDYLIEHYLFPFMQGGQPIIGDLDFSQFTSDDVDDLHHFLDFVSETGAKLANMMIFFSKTAPLPIVGQRAFC